MAQEISHVVVLEDCRRMSIIRQPKIRFYTRDTILHKLGMLSFPLSQEQKLAKIKMNTFSNSQEGVNCVKLH